MVDFIYHKLKEKKENLKAVIDDLLNDIISPDFT
jgi:hypothetical protein